MIHDTERAAYTIIVNYIFDFCASEFWQLSFDTSLYANIFLADKNTLVAELQVGCRNIYRGRLYAFTVWVRKAFCFSFFIPERFRKLIVDSFKH